MVVLEGQYNVFAVLMGILRTRVFRSLLAVLSGCNFFVFLGSMYIFRVSLGCFAGSGCSCLLFIFEGQCGYLRCHLKCHLCSQ